MDKQVLTLILLVVVVSFLGIQVYQISSIKNSITGNVIASVAGSGGIDMSGWSENEKMNYEMHGTVPVRAQSRGAAPTQQQQPAMVGGC